MAEFTREELDAHAMERHREEYLRGEHEAMWSAIKIVYDSKFPMPEWLYKAITAWLDRTETPKQKRARRQRVVDLARFAHIALQTKKGRRVDAAHGIVSDKLKYWGFLGRPEPGAVEDSYKKALKRVKRRRAKKVPK